VDVWLTFPCAILSDTCAEVKPLVFENSSIILSRYSKRKIFEKSFDLSQKQRYSYQKDF
jgi:hypothetical protein